MFKIRNFKNLDLLLLVILAIATIARYWGINFGLPNTNCRPDEIITVGKAFSAGTGNLNPEYFYHPAFYFYFISIFYGLYFILGFIFHRYTSILDFALEYAKDPTNFYLIARSITALLGTLTVFIAYLIARDLFDKRTARVSALFLGLAHLHVRNSHYATTDVAQAFLIMASVFFIMKCVEIKTLKNYVLAGVLAGLAAATKYAGILLAAPMSITHFFNISDGKKRFLDKRIIWFSVAVALAFLIGAPFTVLDFPHFKEHFFKQFGKMNVGQGDVYVGLAFWRQFSFSLFFGLGWSLLFSSIAGLFVFIKKDLRKAMIFGSFPLFYYAFFGKGYAAFSRYMVPIVPFLCITAAVFAVTLGEWLSGYFKIRSTNITISILAILIIFPSVHDIVRYNELLVKRDNRMVAADWILTNIPKGSSIFQFGISWSQPFTSSKIENLRGHYSEALKKGDIKIAGMIQEALQHLQDKDIDRYAQYIYDIDEQTFKLDNEKAGMPQYIILTKPPTPAGYDANFVAKEYHRPFYGDRLILKLLKRYYNLEKTFEVVDINNKKNLYDLQDAFYIPFAGFVGVQRPGPNIYIYKKK